ncbi:EVE domain-containing protein [Shewanella sp. AS16]|uniref:EVE domain-containing protein n=1 Tax=Shewanella sp. AS16 TaxID=2907625 RepID=UPI001F42D28D|nr:EVE domain-containing protein [Shewanella sp. AS16]MCE9688238.1 EVE domain-containing protein [Shewanella sp. AS16]
MNYWLMKSEPHEFSIDDLHAKAPQAEPWQGIRNYQARNFIRDAIQEGDEVFFYHSSCKVPGIVGIARVTSAAYTDASAFDPDSAYHDPKSSPESPRWLCVDIGFVKKFDRNISLSEIKATPALAEMYLVKKGARLSIQPVTADEWQFICHMAAEPTHHETTGA